MSNTIAAELTEMKAEIIDGMISYMEPDEDDDEDFDPGYSKDAVEECASILGTYLNDLASPDLGADSAKIMAAVKGAVLALNALNEKCGGSLIETDQREGICELIIRAAAVAGLQSEEEDITEEWREW